jgi:putative mycofactocin binding protein MftB
VTSPPSGADRSSSLDRPSSLDDGMLDETWQLYSSVSLRPEPFGALAYNFSNRRLTFLKRPDLVEVVRRLDGTRDVRSALSESGVPQERWPAYLQVLATLAGADMIRPVRLGAVAHA